MDEVTEAAVVAMNYGTRVFSDGGVVDQLAQRDPDAIQPLDSRTRLARRLRGVGEAVRMARAVITGDTASEYPRWPKFPDPITGMPQPRQPLPINRKERFYTATVLPAIITSNRSMDLDIFLAMCGLPLGSSWAETDRPWLEVVTEYNLLESAQTEEERERFGTHWLKGDTPDVILAGEDWLIVIEAKMFHRPSKADLASQFANQQSIVAALARGMGIAPDRVRHGFLLVNADQAPTGCGDFVLTWQEVIDAYQGIGPEYWLEALRRAVENYDALKSATVSNAEGRYTGEQILALLAEQPGLITHVGRNRGLGGKDFADDLASGKWRTQPYQTRSSALPASNRNWMSAEDFAKAVKATLLASTPEDP